MTQIEGTNLYKADESCFIIRKADNFVMGEEIDLGSADSIDNYEDKPYTKDEYEAFQESFGRPVRKVEENAAETD